MRAVCLFLGARAFEIFFLRAASTLENTDGEQRALRVLRVLVHFLLAGISLLLKGNVVLRQVTVNNRTQTSKSEQFTIFQLSIMQSVCPPNFA